jgi:hypothetical protein
LYTNIPVIFIKTIISNSFSPRLSIRPRAGISPDWMGGTMARRLVSTPPHRLIRFALFLVAALVVGAILAPAHARERRAAAPLPVDDGAVAAPPSRALGAACGADADCDSGLCRPFRGHTVQLCTRPCTSETQADDCPVPATSGYCSRGGYCRF